MAAATVTSKGQVTIPIDVREKLGIRPGTRVQFIPRPDGGYDFVAASGSIRDLRGMLGAPKRAVTLAEMDDAVADAATERYLGR